LSPVSELARPLIHLVNPLWDPNGGSDWRTIETWRLLSASATAHVWSEYAPHAVFTAECPVHLIRPWRLAFPRRGTIVFVGTYFRVGHWIRAARPERTVIIYNTDQPERLEKNARRIARAGPEPQIVYTSHALRRRHGGSGPVLESPIDVRRFRPLSIARRRGRFTVGRLSRDIRSKHHEDDPALWRALAEAGCAVRIMGGTCLAEELAHVPGIELLPAGAEDAAMFLRSLDCFVYRTSANWFEAYGRAVMEAMATGLPIVASRRGGYAEHLHRGVNALLFDSTEAAIERVLAVRQDATEAARLGVNARHAAVALNRTSLPLRTCTLLSNVPAQDSARRVMPRHVPQL
jgi:glycosyltransferase involved in cell wall biosynthesis